MTGSISPIYTCGHAIEAAVRLNESTPIWQETCMCRDCFQRKTQGQIVSARKCAREHDLPEITGGTPKQRNWARILRDKAFFQYLKREGGLLQRLHPHPP